MNRVPLIPAVIAASWTLVLLGFAIGYMVGRFA